MIDWLLYILECEDGSFYVGRTDNLGSFLSSVNELM